MTKTPPRLYAMLATRAPIAAVFHRGAKGWWLVSRWDLATGRLEHGAWFHGTLYPRRCDLSPDGKLLSYFALKGGITEFLGQRGVKTYSAVSKLPWLFALVAWTESGTWTRGRHFVEGPDASVPPPDLGQAEAIVKTYRFGLAPTMPMQYAAERRRGWIEHPDCPPRSPKDMWDEQRSVILVKERPGGRGRLILTDRGWSAAAQDRIEGRRPSYRFEDGRSTVELSEATWADWDQQGRLLVATETGRLQIRAGRAPLAILLEHDLNGLRPEARPAPDWARCWAP